MDRFQSGSIKDLQLWRAVYESIVNGPGALERREERHALDKILRKYSIVYARKCQRIPKIYQQAQKYRHKVNTEYPFRKGIVKNSAYTSKVEPVASVPPRASTSATGGTPSVISLPSLPHTPQGGSLLRRPTTFCPRPLEEEEEGFQAFANRMDLKQLVIDDSPAKTLRFYNEYYPLLLRKLMAEDRDKYPDRRSVTPNLGPNAKKRGAIVGQRLTALNACLDELDKQMTDGPFYTELRSDTFDPRKWPWNWKRYQ